MKSVLISIQPKWCEKIASGKKTVEVRKSKPNLATPFKCYIYCTNRPFDITDIQDLNVESVKKTAFGRGKVIGEFVCDKVYKIDADSVDWIYIAENYCKYFYEAKDLNCCLTDNELYSYSKGLCLYGWHISDLKIYDKPKEVKEFRKPCCFSHSCSDCNEFNHIDKYCLRRATVPQSWAYIESLGE